MPFPSEQLQNILEAAIMAAGRPLSKSDMQRLFDENEQPELAEIQQALLTLQEKYQSSGVELKEVASGFQFQARTEYSTWLARLWEERPTRYSRAFLETLALIAYRQPITRAEIEDIRGVTVSSNIIKTLLEREWIRVIGYKEIPGKPALYGTTKTFLDDFNLKSLDQLPSLAEIKDLESQETQLQVQLELAQNAIPENEASNETPAVTETEETTPVESEQSSETESHIDETTTTNTHE